MDGDDGQKGEGGRGGRARGERPARSTSSAPESEAGAEEGPLSTWLRGFDSCRSPTGALRNKQKKIIIIIFF